MKGITIRQPWASAILAGLKRYENRSWVPRQLREGRPCWLALHAGRLDPALDQVVGAQEVPESVVGEIGGAGWAKPVRHWDLVREHWPTMPPRDRLPTGSVVGAVEFVGWSRVENLAPDPWATGPMCWEVGRTVVLSTPMPMRGALGLFDVPDAVVEACRVAWRATAQLSRTRMPAGMHIETG